MNNPHLIYKAFYILYLGIAASLFSACADKSSEEWKYELEDDLGRKIRLLREPEKVMALSSSLTEMLYLICKEEKIVARTQNCDYPPQALKKEVVNNYPIDYEKLLSLKPDLIFAKEGIISLEEASKIESMGMAVYFQKYNSVNDILEGIKKLGKILNKSERAVFAADSVQKVIEQLRSSVAGKPQSKVLLLISKEQLFVFGKNSYASDILNYAGASNAVDEEFNNPFPQLTTEYILKINPDIIIGLKGSGLENGELFEEYPELKRLPLYSSKKYYSYPEDLLSRPGPRIGETIRQLINIIHGNVK
jgi:iron complex transport system substrate-binding protein